MQLQNLFCMDGLPAELLCIFQALRLKDGPRRFIGRRHVLLRGPSWLSFFLRVENPRPDTNPPKD